MTPEERAEALRMARHWTGDVRGDYPTLGSVAELGRALIAAEAELVESRKLARDRWEEAEELRLALGDASQESVGGLVRQAHKERDAAMAELARLRLSAEERNVVAAALTDDAVRQQLIFVGHSEASIDQAFDKIASHAPGAADGGG